MSTPRSSPPSVFADPLRRQPPIPGASLRVEMLLWFFALLGTLVFTSSLPTGFHVPSDGEGAPVTWRELRKLHEHETWMLVGAGVGLFALTLLAFRLHVRVHRCEMLLRWRGIDERQVIEGPLPDAPDHEGEAQTDAAT